jgi:RNA polymerase sigma factor (sigma-70 family)
MKLPPFQVVLDDWGPAVHRYLVAAVGPIDADDCFQETMLAALRGYPSLRDDRNLRGWLFTIAHSKVVDGARTRNRAPVPVGDVPERPAPDRDDDRGIWDAVLTLPPKQRSAVACRYVLDLPYRQIGEIVGCTEAAARQNVRAALASLREEAP